MFCYPELVVTPTAVKIEQEDRRRITTYLTLMHGADEEWVGGVAGNQAHHVARKLLYFSRRAQLTLNQAQALLEGEQAEALSLYQSVLLDLTSGDALADEIVRAHEFRISTQVPTAPPKPNQLKKATIFSPASARTIHENPDGWDHLQRWFEHTNDPARPWNVSAISRHLKLTPSVARALLTAPKGAAGMSRTAFSRSRLRQLQRYFAPYGYAPPQ